MAIIGAGDVGGATARALAAMDRVGRVLLVDNARGPAAGKALDIQQSGAVVGFHTNVDATDDMSRVVGASVCVIADRFGNVASEWYGDEGLAMLTAAEPYFGDAPLVFAGSLQATLLSTASLEIGIPRNRLIGSSPEALASALIAVIAVEAQCSPKEVQLPVLGVPGRFVIPWREASIGGYGLDRVLAQVQLTRVQARAEKMWPPGPLTLGTAAACVTDAILTSSRRSFNVFTMLGGEFGVKNRVGAVPARFSPQGILMTFAPALDTRERVSLETALTT